MTVAAVALALALLVSPAAPRRRLTAHHTGSARLPRSTVLALGVAVVGATALWLSFATALAAVLLGATLIVRRRRQAAMRLAAAEGRALQEALDVLVGELRVGAHPVRAFGVAAAETEGTVGRAFRAVAARAGLGADVSAGLRAVAIGSPLAAEWDRLAVFWELAVRHGLAITPLMRAAQLDIVARQRFSAQVSAGMAGARATAAILAALPVLGVVLGEVMGADPLAFLTGGGAGGWLLLAGVGLLCAGLWWADRITDRIRT